MRRLLTLSFLLSLTVPGLAPAATVVRKATDDGLVTTYRAAPGEANALSVTAGIEHDIYVFSDPGATIEAPAACTREEDVVRCPTGRFPELAVTLGDSDDTLTLTKTERSFIGTFEADGGPGNDTLTADALNLRGGPGDDEITSTHRFGNLIGGPGTDSLRGKADQQNFDGGPGSDAIDTTESPSADISFAETTEAVTADLADGGQMGPAGEPDTVTGSIASITTGSGDDVITGSPAGNAVNSGAGDDAVDGGGGRDHIDGGGGADRLIAGDGDDVLRDGGGPLDEDTLADGGEGDDELHAVRSATVLGGGGNDHLRFGAKATEVNGGAGRDYLQTGLKNTRVDNLACGDGRDAVGLSGVLLPEDCERIAFPNSKVLLQIPNAVELDGRTLTAPVPNLCFEREVCDIRADLRVGRRRIGRDVAHCSRRNGKLKNGRAVYVISAADLGAIEAAGSVTLHLEPPKNSFLGPRVVVFPAP